jgi:hypothetical protein
LPRWWRKHEEQTWKSVGAVLAGLLMVAVVSVGTDLVLHATGVFPPWGQPVGSGVLLLATVYRTIYSVAGAYLTARLAPDRPMRHALALGGVGPVLSVARGRGDLEPGTSIRAALVSARASSAGGSAVLGGALRGMQLRARSTEAANLRALRRDKERRARDETGQQAGDCCVGIHFALGLAEGTITVRR